MLQGSVYLNFHSGLKCGARKMAQFVIKQASGRGASHPITARLSVQMTKILDFSGLDKAVKDDVLKMCLGGLPSRLGKCWDIWKHLEEEQNRCKIGYTPSDNRVVQIPQILNLDRDVDNFLYEAKNFLRDIAELVLCRCFPELTYPNAGKFYI